MRAQVWLALMAMVLQAGEDRQAYSHGPSSRGAEARRRGCSAGARSATGGGGVRWRNAVGSAPWTRHDCQVRRRSGLPLPPRSSSKDRRMERTVYPQRPEGQVHVWELAGDVEGEAAGARQLFAAAAVQAPENRQEPACRGFRQWLTLHRQ